MNETGIETPSAWSAEIQVSGPSTVQMTYCPRCGSVKGQWRGYRTTRNTIKHRRRCSDCGAWFAGATTETHPLQPMLPLFEEEIVSA